MQNDLQKWLRDNASTFHPVIKIDPVKEKVIAFDLSERNMELKKIDIADIDLFCQYIDNLLKIAGAKFGSGGYNEIRAFYSGSDLFNETSKTEEPRRLHIGFDIWGDAGTEVFAPCDGFVHSFAFNNNFGDYGATIILRHEFKSLRFYTLYGHISLEDLKIREGDEIHAGQLLAHFGAPEENGHWPPHLHFQVIHDIENYKGDYPGVCKFSEREKYLENCPDPELILKMNQIINQSYI